MRFRSSNVVFAAASIASIAALTCTVLFLFQPSGDGLYVLPVAMAALLAVVGSIIATVNVRRGSKQSTIRPSA